MKLIERFCFGWRMNTRCGRGALTSAKKRPSRRSDDAGGSDVKPNRDRRGVGTRAAAPRFRNQPLQRSQTPSSAGRRRAEGAERQCEGEEELKILLTDRTQHERGEPTRRRTCRW